MGAFLLIKNTVVNHNALKSALTVFERKKLKLNKQLNLKDYSLYVFYKRSHQIQNIYIRDERNFIVCLGTFLYEDYSKIDAIQKFFEDFSINSVDFSKMFGHYCIIIYKNDNLFIFNDFEGIYHVYMNQQSTVLSNSFLAISEFTYTKTISTQEIFEYIFFGTFYGDKSIFNEIIMLNNKSILKLLPNTDYITKNTNYNTSVIFNDFNSLIELISKSILDYFFTLNKNFSNEIIMGLSGGYDSRLVLAALLATNTKPKVYVSGEETSPDYRISKLIAENENLEFENYRESTVNKLNVDEYISFVNDKYFFTDGLSDSGLFTSVMNMDIENSTKRLLNLNGAAGEIFRNLWFLKGKRLNKNLLIKAIYDNFNSTICTNEFHHETFFRTLTEKAKDSLNDYEGKINISNSQKLYANFELKYSAGRKISLLNQYSYALIPFSETRFTILSNEIPIGFKTAGVFQAALINKLNNRVANYNSVYGYNFSSKINLKFKLYDYTIILTPLIIRPLLWKFKARKKRLILPYYLADEYKKKLFDTKNMFMNKFIKINSIEDRMIFSRVLTLEYFLNRQL